MSGQSAGAGFCKSPLSLVRRSTRSVRALASVEGGAFSNELQGARGRHLPRFEFTGRLLKVTVDMHADQKLDGDEVGAAEMARQ
jgi:hypothetical protein